MFERFLESNFFESAWAGIFIIYIVCIAAVAAALFADELVRALV